MKTRSSSTIRHSLMLIIAAMALLATSCGSDPVVLQGDTSEQTQPDAVAEPTVAVPSPVQETPEGDAEDDGVALDVGQDNEPTPEDEAPAAQVTQIVASGGAVDTLTNVQISVGETVATEAEIQSYIDGEPALDASKNWLVTEVYVESQRSLTGSMRAGNFTLVDGDGGRHPAVSMYDPVGEKNSVNLQGRDSRASRISFATEGLVSDTTGWMIEVSSGEGIPLLMPLSGSRFDHPYPLQLSDGAESLIELGPFVACVSASFVSKVERATISLEGTHRDTTRVPAGERLVAIDLAVTGTPANAENRTTSGYANCTSVLVWPDLVLNVDGRPSPAFPFNKPRIEGLSSSTLPLEFQIPASASLLELTIDSTVLASWDVSLPTAVGETGANLVPFNATRTNRTERAPAGGRPDALTTETLSDGGATGTMLLTSFGVRDTVATNSEIDRYIDGSAEIDADGRTWLVVGIDVESTETVTWSVHNSRFVLKSPQGQPTSATVIYNRAGGEEGTVPLSGVEYHDLRLAFETNGLVTDLEGWSLFIEDADLRPLELPLIGPAPAPAFPAALRTPVGAEVPTIPFSGCTGGGLLDVVIDEAAVEIEADSDGSRVRVNRDEIMITMELSVTSLVLPAGNCGSLVVWPEFLLDVDGRRTRALSHVKPSMDQFETKTVSLRFVIPEESQKVSLVGGSGSTVVGMFLLRDAGQVLLDLDAARVDARTVITLDETLLFAFGESTLQQDAFAPLTRVANVLSTESSGQVTVVGHTDAIGDDASNEALSLARAEAVAAALIEAGVDASRLEVSGAGESSPIAPNQNDDGSDNPAGREQNRRVEISFESE